MSDIRNTTLEPLLKPLYRPRYEQMRGQYPFLPTFENLGFRVLTKVSGFSDSMHFQICLDIRHHTIAQTLSINTWNVRRGSDIENFLRDNIATTFNSIFELLDQYCGTQDYQYLNPDFVRPAGYRIEGNEVINTVWKVKENASVTKVDNSPNAAFYAFIHKAKDYEVTFAITQTEISEIGKEFNNCLSWNNKERKYGFLLLRVGTSRKVCLCLTSGEAKAANNAQCQDKYLAEAIVTIKKLGVIYNEKAPDFNHYFQRYDNEIQEALKPKPLKENRLNELPNILKGIRETDVILTKSRRKKK